MWLAGAILLAGVGAYGVARWYANRPEGPIRGKFHTVVPADMEILINKVGELQALNNTDVPCQVEGQTAIQWLVKEGTDVQKGDVLVLLDSSAITQKREDTELELEKAKADMTTSREMRDIQESQNSANLEAAEVALQLARIDLDQYEKGTFPQQLQTTRVSLEVAQTSLKTKQEDLEQTRNLAAKGFVTPADVKKGELDVINSQNEVDKAQTALMVLEKYTHEMDSASKRSTLAQAEQKLARTKRENASNLAQKNADVRAKEQATLSIERKLAKYREQEAFCRITAPESGLVVYASSGDRNAQTQIQEGASVRERQILLRLPDVTQMKAVVRLLESEASRLTKLAAGQTVHATVKIEGIARPVTATLYRIAPVADSGSRWASPDIKEYPVELKLDDTPRGLKPGFTAQVSILLDHIDEALAVPIEAIYTEGRSSFVFVRHGNDVSPQAVGLGGVTDKDVQIKSGISAGDEVLLLTPGQGPALLQKSGVKVEPASQPSGERGKGRGRRGGGINPPGTPGGNGGMDSPTGGSGINPPGDSGVSNPPSGMPGPQHGSQDDGRGPTTQPHDRLDGSDDSSGDHQPRSTGAHAGPAASARPAP